jgi:hypothetical protein
MLRSRRELNADNVTKPRKGSVGTAWGRTAWSTTVVFICFAEQLAATGKDATICYVGDSLPEIKCFDRKWMKLRA